MASRQWGLLCPEDGGLLVERDEWTRQGVTWCPNSDIHGGNGRMWRRNEVKEGWYDPTRPPEPTEAYLQRQAAIAARVAEHEAQREAQRIADARRRRTVNDEKKAAKAPAKVKEPQNCLCGCGGQTKGGRFIPGHDARFHSRVRTLTNQFGLGHDEAEKIASKGPLTGKYAVKPQTADKAAASTTKPTTAKADRAARAKAPDLTKRADEQPDTPAAESTTETPDIEV